MISPEKAYQAVNKVRTKQGLTELNWSNDLADLALQRAIEIYDSNNWSHESPRGKGKYGTTTAYDLMGENLARKFRNSDNMIKAWQDSPTHLKNMTQDFTDTGVATYGNVTVQLFGRRVAKTAITKPKVAKKEKRTYLGEAKMNVKTTTPAIKLKRK